MEEEDAEEVDGVAVADVCGPAADIPDCIVHRHCDRCSEMSGAVSKYRTAKSAHSLSTSALSDVSHLNEP